MIETCCVSRMGIFTRKVGKKTIPDNKEEAMHLQYAYILRQLIPLTSHSGHEVADIELETGVKTRSGTNEIDNRGDHQMGESKSKSKRLSWQKKRR